MSQLIELDIDLENDILEWSEEFNINNDALVSLIEILRKRISTYQNNTLNKSKNIDQGTQSEINEYNFKVSQNIESNNLKEYLEDLKQTQKSILKEVANIRLESKCNRVTMNSTRHMKRPQKKILDFPIKSLKHFQRLENICETNDKLYKKLVKIFLSNEKFGQNKDFNSIDDFFKFNFDMLLDQNLITYLASYFCETFQIKNCAIFRCFKDAALEKFSNKSCKEIYTSILLWFKKYSSREDCKLNTEEEFYDTTETNSFEHNAIIDLELFLLDFLPCDSIEELLKFDQHCRELSNFENVAISLFKLGSQLNLKNFINISMKRVFSEKIVSNINMIEIKNLKYIEILLEYVLQNFDEISYENEIIEIILQWIKENQENEKRPIKIESIEDNIVELKMDESLNYNSNEIQANDSDDEMCDYNEEFLEEENLLHLLPCKTASSLQKFEEMCCLDISLQAKLKQLFCPNELDRINFKENTSNEDVVYTSFFPYEIQHNLKLYIEHNIRKIATDEAIANFTWFINQQSESYENLNYDDNVILKILHECIQQTFPTLSKNCIRNQIENFINQMKKNLNKNSEESKMKLQKIPSQQVITSDSHPIHLQSILNLPINNFESLRSFNLKCLNDEEMSFNLFSMFLQVSEKDCIKFIDKNLRKLITESIGAKLTWNGIQDNIAVKDFYIMKLLIDAAKKYFPNYGEEAFIDCIKLALRRFKDRLRKRKSGFSVETLDDDEIKMYYDTSMLNDDNELTNNKELLQMNNDIIKLRKIPCRTIEEFQNLEKYCKKFKDLQINLKYLFDSNTNDKDAVKFISENLKRIVIDSVLGHFTYNGLKNNIGVKYYSIIRILMDSLIRKNPYLSEEDAIKNLRKALLLAKDRQRFVFKKRRKKNNE